MKKLLIFLVIISTVNTFSQENSLKDLQFIIGNWSGSGQGFSNSALTIKASYHFVMDNKYIEVKHESFFKPTEKNEKGEHHVDIGFISFDTSINNFIYRQFNNEGYMNQYVLKEELTTNMKLIFETEIIENFMAGGKARFTINKIAENEIETIFDVSFPNKEYSCFGTNNLKKLNE